MVKRIIPRLRTKVVWQKLGAGPLRRMRVVKDLRGFGITRMRSWLNAGVGGSAGVSRRGTIANKLYGGFLTRRQQQAMLSRRKAQLLERRMRGPSLKMRMLMWRKSVEATARRERTQRLQAIRKRIRKLS